MRFGFLTALVLGMGVLAAPSAQAQDYKTLLDIPQGSTLINLSATERVEVEQDLLIANLRYQDENKDAKAVQDAVNAKMKAALDEAEKVDSVKANTQQYYVHEYDRSRGKSVRPDIVWRAQQGLVLKGKTADELLKLTGTLQEMGLVMSGLSYSVSPELLEETRNALLENALKKLRAKAERTAKALGKSSSEFLQVNVDVGGNGGRPPVMRAMSMDMSMAKAEMAAPVAAPGESEVTLSVSANVLISE